MKFNYSKKVRVEKSEEMLKKVEKTAQEVLEQEFGESNVAADKSSAKSMGFTVKRDTFWLKSSAAISINTEGSEGYALEADATMDIPVTTWIIVGAIAFIGLFAFFLPGVAAVCVFFVLTFSQKNKFTRSVSDSLDKISNNI